MYEEIYLDIYKLVLMIFLIVVSYVVLVSLFFQDKDTVGIENEDHVEETLNEEPVQEMKLKLKRNADRHLKDVYVTDGIIFENVEHGSTEDLTETESDSSDLKAPERQDIIKNRDTGYSSDTNEDEYEDLYLKKSKDECKIKRRNNKYQRKSIDENEKVSGVDSLMSETLLDDEQTLIAEKKTLIAEKETLIAELHTEEFNKELLTNQEVQVVS